MLQGKNRLSFDISTAREFFSKLKQEQQSLKADLTSSRHAINAAMTAWHLVECVWGLAVKGNPHVQQRIGKHSKNLPTFRKYLLSQCPQLESMQCICEGAKHLGTSGSNVKITSVHSGAFNDGFGKGLDINRLQIEKEDGSVAYFDNELKEVVDFWEHFFKVYLV